MHQIHKKYTEARTIRICRKKIVFSCSNYLCTTVITYCIIYFLNYIIFLVYSVLFHIWNFICLQARMLFCNLMIYKYPPNTILLIISCVWYNYLWYTCLCPIYKFQTIFFIEKTLKSEGVVCLASALFKSGIFGRVGDCLGKYPTNIMGRDNGEH